MNGPLRPRRRRRILYLAGAAALFALLYLSRVWWLGRWSDWLDVSEPPRPADYVMVLGGGADSRPFAAAALWKKRYARGVLVANTRRSPEAEDGILPTESELVRRVLTMRGVPDDAVTVLPGEADSTFDEAEALRRFFDGRPDVTVTIVTTNYHTRRARSVFRRVLGTAVAARVGFVGVPTDGFDAANWWQSEDGFTAYLGESIKSVYYAVRY